MPKPDLKNIDPKKIYMHARGFYSAGNIFGNLPQLDADPALRAELGPTVTVLSSLTIELFMKCLVCLESGLTPQGHHLDYLYGRISEDSRTFIEEVWTSEVLPHRKAIWDKIEAYVGKKINRDLTAALRGASRSFEQLRYGYEGPLDTEFFVGDLPRVLGRAILRLKPEWTNLTRPIREIG